MCCKKEERERIVVCQATRFWWISFGLEVGFSGFIAWAPGHPGVDFGEVLGGAYRSGGGNPRPLKDCSPSRIQ